jgi:hypothetical protein
VVQQGDTLANIVRKYYKIPPFGKNGGVAKLVELNKEVIKDPNHVPPGTVLRLNKELLKEGMTDKDEGTQAAEVESDEESEEASAEGLSPYIEVEKYDAAKPLKEKSNDSISLFAKFNFNDFEAKDRVTQATAKFTTSSDTNVGVEYVKSVSDNLNILGMIMLSQYSSPNNTTVTPPLEAAEKAQGAYSLGLRYIFMPDSFMDFTLNYLPHYYLLQNSSGNLVLENKESPSASISMQNYFYQSKDASVGLDIGFEFITNTEDSGRGSTNSSSYHAGLIYRENFKEGDHVAVEFSFKDASTDTVQYNLSDRTFALSFMYSLPY